MKGKGKNMGSQDKDCPLQYPDFLPVDHTKLCPRYTAVLQRDKDDSVSIVELDSLQTEMETLFSSVAKRMRLLEGEVQILTNWQDRASGKKGGKGTPSPCPSPSGKRGKGSDERPSKKFKSDGGKGGPSRGGKNRSSQPAKILDYSYAESPINDLPKLPKNEASRFWTAVEPYCADITNNDLKVLQDLLQCQEDDSDYYKIPPLGKHYSQKWSQDDMFEEQKEGAKITDKRLSSSSTSAISDESSTLLSRTENNMDIEESSPFGPLTQRLVSALIEENIMAPMEDSNEIENQEAIEANAAMSPKSLAKQLNIGNTVMLERRIRRELEEQGILEADDVLDSDPEDEILQELKKKQSELKAVTQHNTLVTKKLLRLAKDEMERQELRKKMAAADLEVMETWRKIQNARQKKKVLTKKEKEVAFKVLKERETIVKQLELSYAM
ncbi:unnamed protein product [Owenia fusiformis]|uniref:Uncharacterized protein n=1 Tax=Owenia fusiformis TaxID=6347 RepID=A0A8J1TYF6_OWEFU|nr:unnamed protein product [Owenia fusiformis]